MDRNYLLRMDIKALENCFKELIFNVRSSNVDLSRFISYIDTIFPTKRHIKNVIKYIEKGGDSTISDYRYLQKLNASLVDVVNCLNVVESRLEQSLLPFSHEVVGEPIEIYEDYFIGNIRHYIDQDDSDMNKCLDEINDILSNVFTLYAEHAKKFLPIIRDSLNDILELSEAINGMITNYANVIENAYYEYLEDNGSHIEDELYDSIYEKEIVGNMAIEPTTKDWAILLKEKITALQIKPNVKVINEVFSQRRALDIKDSRVIRYIFDNCTIEEDLTLFFYTFAEIAILQEKTKKDIEMIRRPEPGEEMVELPSMVVESIRSNQYLSRLFKKAICGLAPNTGKTGFKTKWSHVKTALEHNNLVTEVNPSEFGRQIHDICPDVDADKCRQNVGTNQLNIPNNKKYFDLLETSPIQIQCTKVADEFKEIIEELQK